MNKIEIANGLRELGLKNGDKVLLHSSLVSLGNVEGGPDAVIDAFIDVIGKEGTLLVPVFGDLGIITSTLKKRPGAVVSSCPVGTLAALGADAEAICKDHWQASTAHGADTPFTRLADMDGYVCLLGCDQDRNTSLHGVEALLQLPYLKDKEVEFTNPAGENVTRTYKYYPGPHRDFIGIDRYYREAGVMNILRIGNSQVRLIKSKDLFDIALAIGSEDPAFVLYDNPACMDCVTQRAAIFADRISKESFRLSASSRLAGRYVPEMVENLRNAGISFIELDYVQGKSCAMLDGEKLQKITAELRDENISISGLSVTVVPNDIDAFIQRVKSAGISRIILPVGAFEAAAAAKDNGLEVLFRNINHTGINAANAIRELGGKSACFNPPAFVLAGERPFLASYRAGRYIRLMGQLDIADGIWDGTPKTFVRGNGEVKELISILRCHNFDGFMCLGGGSVYPGSLQEAADEFIWMLDNM